MSDDTVSGKQMDQLVEWEHQDNQRIRRENLAAIEKEERRELNNQLWRLERELLQRAQEAGPEDKQLLVQRAQQASAVANQLFSGRDVEQNVAEGKRLLGR